MKLFRQVVPISKDYDNPVFEALAIQAIIGLLSLMILDGGQVAQVCGVALLAFWAGASLLIYRRRLSPSRTDLQVIRFGYLPVLVIAQQSNSCCSGRAESVVFGFPNFSRRATERFR
ncbi:MAG TPA: hypothetical protein VG146_17555 [Verrucomicrobiae bacterium]|nr:hypothetical protein [Verrucomicrobiae bacterium]